MNFFYTVEPDCIVLHWPLYPLALVLWLVLTPLILIALLCGLLNG